MEVDKALYLLTCLLEKHKALGKFYRMGGNDAEIAAAVGTSKRAICAWRRRRSLRANYTPSPKGGEPAL